jgi:hypothetical protein
MNSEEFYNLSESEREELVKSYLNSNFISLYDLEDPGDLFTDDSPLEIIKELYDDIINEYFHIDDRWLIIEEHYITYSSLDDIYDEYTEDFNKWYNENDF